MILNMIWHVLQKVTKCYLVRVHRLDYIYLPIYFKKDKVKFSLNITVFDRFSC